MKNSEEKNIFLLKEIAKSEAIEIFNILKIQKNKLNKIKDNSNKTINLISINENIRKSLKSRRIVFYLIVLFLIILIISCFFIIKYFNK